MFNFYEWSVMRTQEYIKTTNNNKNTKKGYFIFDCFIPGKQSLHMIAHVSFTFAITMEDTHFNLRFFPKSNG
jgi:hypothetical protein